MNNSRRLAPWQPLIPEDAHGSIDRILAGIAESLWETRAALALDLATGLPGVALFFAELSLHPGFESARDRALSLLEAGMNGAETVTDPSLFLGLSGISWSVERVYQTLFPETTEDFNADTDELLIALLSQTPWNGPFDLISGLVGVGVYALERMPRPSARSLLLQVLTHLEATVADADFGVAWLTRPSLVPAPHRTSSPKGHFDFGTAHGTPGVLSLLLAMRTWGLEAKRIDELLRYGMAWLQHSAATPECREGLPAWIALEGVATKGTRTAWCYGDLGCAVALLDVDPTFALSLGRRAASLSFEASGVRDTSLCHGSAGNAHLFNRLYQRTGEALFSTAARNYFDAVLLSCAPNRPFAGITAYLPDREAPGGASLQAAPGLLEGAAGVGLALLSGMSATPPRWDRAFLASHHVEGAA